MQYPKRIQLMHIKREPYKGLKVKALYETAEAFLDLDADIIAAGWKGRYRGYSQFYWEREFMFHTPENGIFSLWFDIEKGLCQIPLRATEDYQLDIVENPLRYFRKIEDAPVND